MKLRKLSESQLYVCRHIPGRAYIVPCANCESELPVQLKTGLTTYLKISRIHLKPSASQSPTLLLIEIQTNPFSISKGAVIICPR